MATIIAETDGFNLFTSQRQLTSYAEYDVIENQSGNERTKIRIKGYVAVQRKLLILMYALWKNGTTYQATKQPITDAHICVKL